MGGQKRKKERTFGERLRMMEHLREAYFAEAKKLQAMDEDVRRWQENHKKTAKKSKVKK